LIWGLRPQTPCSLAHAIRLQSKALRQIAVRSRGSLAGRSFALSGLRSEGPRVNATSSARGASTPRTSAARGPSAPAAESVAVPS